MNDCALGDLADIEQEVLRVTTLVYCVADASEQEKSDKGTCNGQEPDNLVRGAPFIANFLEEDQQDNAGKPNACGSAIACSKVCEHVVDDGRSPGANILFANLVKGYKSALRSENIGTRDIK